MRFLTILSNPKLYNWILRIKESSANGKWQEVIYGYSEVKRAGAEAADYSLLLPLVIKAYSNLSCGHGKSFHACLVKQGYESYTSVGNSILDFYSKYGDLNAAVTAFRCMTKADSISWNIVIHGHLTRGSFEEGLEWFTCARISGFDPNISILVLVIQACHFLQLKQQLSKLHAYLIHSGFYAISSVQNSLLGAYVDAGMQFARQLFDEMRVKDVIAWSVLINGYVQREESQVGLAVFREMVMLPSIKPDGVTIVSVLKGCANLAYISMGRLVHVLVICRGLVGDTFVQNSLIDMYSRCNDADSAFKVFCEISQRNNVSWNSMLSGFVLNQNYVEALSLITSMQKDGPRADEATLVSVLKICKYFELPSQCKSVHCTILRRGFDSNAMLLNSIIDAYAKSDLVELAWEVFARTRRKDVTLWSTMIAGFGRCGRPDEAIAVFREMSNAREMPNSITIVNLLEACSISADLKRSQWAHGVAVRRGMGVEVGIGTAIVDLYAKCGNIKASRKWFDQIPHKNVVTWSAMVAAYGMNGLPHEALALVAEMKLQGVKPNAVTALSVLCACSHGGLVEEGLSFFRSMVEEDGIEPGVEHYSCVVDLLGRAGELNNAMEVIKMMGGNASAWSSVLSACRSQGNSKLGEGAISRVTELEPLSWANYMVASGMYGGEGKWVDAGRMRMVAKERGVKVVSGYSLVHICDKAHFSSQSG
ncbi:hypothetical protein K2173_010485 [Erythroxylum novogranatense]|uniref:Pentatricopeptide repeat-containing protein n=1 Tax=Erythroxylum novogranatense TaxID=1862640 RepID=A0AAV8TE66_9ROSI|nr:hypothetical protein K2173_010485 [Erythroxylum novogranatense]